MILYFLTLRFENEEGDQDVIKKALQNGNYKAIESMTKR